MSRLGAKTYSRKAECKQSMQFDNLLSDKGNKPSTAKVSVAAVHRWGMTSFTSLRKSRINGGKKDVAETVEPIKKVKLDTNPDIIPCNVDHFSFESDIKPSSQNISSPPVNDVEIKVKPAAPKPNKFFKSGSRLGKNSSSKNSDFDALRMSVPAHLSSLSSNKSSDMFINLQSNVKMNAPCVNDESPSVYLTTSKPNFLDMQYRDASDTSASINYSHAPNIHYISPKTQPSVSESDSSSRAFDALFGKDFTTKVCDPIVSSSFQSLPQPSDYFVKDSSVPLVYLEPEENTLNETSLNHQLPLHNLLNQDISSNKFCDKEEECDSSEQIEEQPCGTNNFLLPSDSGELESKSITSSQETLTSSQSSEKSDNSVSSKLSSRPRKIFSSSLKCKAVYNHRHWHSSKKPDENSTDKGPSLADEFEDEIAKENFSDSATPVATNISSAEMISFKSPSASTEFYTVVKNVKQAYQCHESGETQEFNDDIDYLLECVQECNGIGTRCLSVLNLAAKCMGPAFRIHLRAHGTMPKIFSALKDAPTDPNLALCTATLMFVLSQDRLTMDIEASTLSLMLQLLETDLELRNPEKEFDLILKDPALCAMQDKHREKVYSLCEEMQQKGHAKHLKLDNINTGILAMETLLSLTSRKAGEWFKEEMRTLRGLDRIVDSVTSFAELLYSDENEDVVQLTEVQIDKIRKIDRCLRVLENVTHLNPENQEYLLCYKDSSLITSSLSLLKLFKSYLLEQTPVEYDGTVDEGSQKVSKDESPIISCLLNILKILSNITYRIALDDTNSKEGLMDQILMLILQAPRSLPFEKRFDLLVLSLGLMINLVEYCPKNSSKFIEMHALGSFDGVNDGYEMPVTEALIELMLLRLEAARVSEEQADELLNSQEEKQAASIEKKDLETAADDLEETLMKTLQKAGKHMEHSIIAAYIAILLGCVSQKNPDFIEIIRDYVPDGKFDVMVEVLKKFKSFVTLTGSVGNRELASIQKVIHILESS